MITPTEIRKHPVDGSTWRLYLFENGNTASLVRCVDEKWLSSYGAREGLYEMATITPTGDIIDVVGYLDEDAVVKELERRRDTLDRSPKEIL